MVINNLNRGEDGYKNGEIAKGYMSALEKAVGQQVRVELFEYGKERTIESQLKAVKAFESITVGNEGMPFIGFSTAVAAVYSLDKSVCELYYNPHLGQGYKYIGLDEIETREREIFGDAVADAKIAQRKEVEAHLAEERAALCINRKSAEQNQDNV